MRPTQGLPFCWMFGALFVLGSLAASGPARAQDIAAAEALFDKGVADMKAGRYETGCKAIAESQRIDPRPGTLFTLATCEAQWGRIATAVSRYGDYLAVYERLPDDKKTPKGAVVEERITIRRGENRAVTLEVKAGEPVPSLTPATTATAGTLPATVEPVRTGPSARRVAAYVVGGTGLAGLVAGGVMGGLAVAQRGVMDQHCGAAIGQADRTACDRTGLDASSTAKTAAAGSTIALAGGGALTVTALVLLFTEPKRTAAGGATPKTGAQGRWVSAGVLSVGPQGTLLGAQGAW
jgi:hypothetical protein